jgi:hypothetical protein
MYTTTCWQCGVRASMPAEGAYARTQYDEDGVYLGEVKVEMYACPDCDMPTLISTTDADDDQIEIHAGVRGREYGPEVPTAIAATASEACIALGVGALRGSVMLARAVVEATCKDRGITSGTLVAKIDGLHQQAFISVLVRDEAHEIRHAGNDMAHGDLEASIDMEDAADMLALMENVIQEVYVRPAQLGKRQARRVARKSMTPTTQQ